MLCNHPFRHCFDSTNRILYNFPLAHTGALPCINNQAHGAAKMSKQVATQNHMIADRLLYP